MGRAVVAGGNPSMQAPVSGIVSSKLAVGSTVKLMENGTPVEYLVVNQGIPSGSSLYDSSCNGTWLLRKNIYTSSVAWHSSQSNNYKNASVRTYLNSTFFKVLGAIEQATILQVKIPYVNGTGSAAVASGASGLSSKVFLLSGYEVGWTKSNHDYFPVDGACLAYFSGTKATDTKRIGYFNGTATNWWLRSPYQYDEKQTWAVQYDGYFARISPSSNIYGIRPALVLPSNALFDAETMILKGVA